MAQRHSSTWTHGRHADATDDPHDRGMDEAPRLSMLEAGGFRASIDAFALEQPPDATTYHQWLWCVSMLGNQQSVKALWARLLKGEVVNLSIGATLSFRFCRLAPGGATSWRFFTMSLPSAAGYHGVLLPEAARYASDRPEFVLFPRREDEAPTLYERFLNRRVDVPLHASWAEWLWSRAVRTGEAVRLESQGIEAYRCAPDPGALAADVSAAVRGGALVVPDPSAATPLRSR